MVSTMFLNPNSLLSCRYITNVKYYCLDMLVVLIFFYSDYNILLLCWIDMFVVSEQHRYDTAYACEGKTLKIECKDGEIIHLIRANYGRFSITICNDHGNTEWSVNCMSPKSLRVLHSKYVQQNSYTCQVLTLLRSILVSVSFRKLLTLYKAI